MNTYTNVSNELKAYFSNNSIFKILLPIDMIFLFGGLAIMVLSGIFGINFGGLIGSIAYWAFILGLLLTFANSRELFLYSGLLGYGALNLIELLLYLIRAGHYFSWGNLFAAAIFGGLGYLVFQRKATGSSDAGVSG